MTDTRKRHRSVSVSSGSSGISLPEDVPTKYHRAPSPDKEYLCTLPPTCSQPETAQRFASAAELDAHQTSFHKYLCRVPIRDKPGRIGEGALVPVMPEHFTGRMPGRAFNSKWRECGKAFPDGRLLEIHQTETHDPLARERIERGEKIFACFLPTDQCSKTFATPKQRRWHLINDHHYPHDYFFSITNHGLNQLARNEGMAASLIRPRRDPPPKPKPRRNSSTHNVPPVHPEESHTPALPPSTTHHAPIHPPDDDIDMDALVNRMAGLESSLSFVPRNVARRARKETRGMDV